jgi:FlaA1/EpsC-like NDP-sugar epimerase
MLIIKASTINNTIFAMILLLIWQLQGFPRSVILIDWFLFIMIFAGTRVFYRYYFEMIGLDDEGKNKIKKKKCLIIGAGDGAESLIRSMINNQINYNPVCIVDKDQNKWNRYLHGIKIQGPLDRVHELAKKYEVEEIIIAIPSASNEVIQEILKYVEPCSDSNISYKTVPSLNELLTGRKPLTAIRDIKIEDLINRKLVIIDKMSVRQELKGKVIMVSGAAGSIGSELVRQIAQFDPKQLLLIDRNENNLMYLIKEIDDMVPKVKYKTYIVDITDEIKLDQLFDKHRPDYIFHAAAYKHVPFMEDSPDEAIKNNVYGTKIMSGLAEKYQAYKFVLISTDKAVNPVNIMGCTKKLAELYLLNYFKKSTTNFIIVRFGNVLGSEGSVIPIFSRQIKSGQAVTVTHPDMRRYLMTIPEAVSLTLEAGFIGNHSDILILDMGKQIRVLDIAENLIKLSGFKPYVDIPIKFTGVRPGEKMYEELWDKYENPIQTKHPKIFKVPNGEYDESLDFELFNQLILRSLKHEHIDENRMLMKKLVPTFEYQNDVLTQARQTERLLHKS